MSQDTKTRWIGDITQILVNGSVTTFIDPESIRPLDPRCALRFDMSTLRTNKTNKPRDLRLPFECWRKGHHPPVRKDDARISFVIVTNNGDIYAADAANEDPPREERRRPHR